MRAIEILFGVIMDFWEREGVVDLLYTDEEIAASSYSNLYAKAIRDLKDEFADSGMDKSDFIYEWADRNVEIYTVDIYKWYAKNANRSSYAQDALMEVGTSEYIDAVLQRGMYLLLRQFAIGVLGQ